MCVCVQVCVCVCMCVYECTLLYIPARAQTHSRYMTLIGVHEMHGRVHPD